MSMNTPNPDAISRLAELIRGIRFTMMTTLTHYGELHSRPMATQDREFDGTLWFFTSAECAKVHDLAEHSQVNLAYSDPDNNRYVSIAGRATVLRDPARARELWSPLHKAWFPKGVDDPDLRLIRVDVTSAEYWDAPSSKMVQLVGFAKSLITGQPYRPGENQSVQIA
jgi:general stress protein 26